MLKVANQLKSLKSFWKDDRGIGTLEIILIIAVVLIIALMFKDWIIDIVKDLLKTADKKVDNFIE